MQGYRTNVEQVAQLGPRATASAPPGPLPGSWIYWQYLLCSIELNAMQRGGRAHPVGRGERLRLRDGLALLGRGLARRRLRPPGLGLDLRLLSVRKTEVSST